MRFRFQCFVDFFNSRKSTVSPLSIVNPILLRCATNGTSSRWKRELSFLLLYLRGTCILFLTDFQCILLAFHSDAPIISTCDRRANVLGDESEEAYESVDDRDATVSDDSSIDIEEVK